MTPKIFVGTMYVCEGDYFKCCYSIASQENIQFTHRVITGLDEKSAHNQLWDAWNTAKFDHDLFIKVDADTVIRDNKTFSRIWELFEENPRLTGIQAPLHDYMTDSMIYGLNIFSPKVSFNPTKDGLYCDRGVDAGHDIVYRTEQLPPELVPVGYHCHYSSEMQAFHYGVHRALKGQNDKMALVRAAYNKSLDRIRAFALAGQFLARNFSNTNHNYSDPFFQQAFMEATEIVNQDCSRQKALK